MSQTVKQKTDESVEKTKATSNSKKVAVKSTSSKSSPVKKVASKKTVKKETLKKTTEAKKVAKKDTKKTTKVTKKSTTKKKKINKVPSLATSRKTSTISLKTVDKIKENKKDFANILEYYDLPYRYNETVVKILAQTPKVLFVYWDISDDDKEKYKEKYGEYFFNDTYPVLIVHNKTLNYYQEIEINDFANSWYISISDSRSEYSVELGRRFKEYTFRNESQSHKDELNSVISFTESNDLIMPNDHVLLDEIKSQVKYRNVKTGQEYFKNVYSILANNKLIDFYELYKGIYQVEDLSTFLNLNNPSSGNPTSTFK